jgi:transposase-like protein
MKLHRNAKLGLAGRYALVHAIEEGMSLKAAAAAFSVSPATAHRWWHRWQEAGEESRNSLACLLDRSSCPRRSPCELARHLQERICACRLKTGWGPRLVACTWTSLAMRASSSPATPLQVRTRGKAGMHTSASTSCTPSTTTPGSLFERALRFYESHGIQDPYVLKRNITYVHHDCRGSAGERVPWCRTFVPKPVVLGAHCRESGEPRRSPLR